MCEFCPIAGHCIVCDTTTPVPYSPPRARDLLPPEHQSTSSDDGFRIRCQGVVVKFDRHSDALACLHAIPQAEVM